MWGTTTNPSSPASWGNCLPWSQQTKGLLSNVLYKSHPVYCIASQVWCHVIFICKCSGGFYSRNDGKTWILTMLLTATLFPTMSLSIAFVLNSIAIGYHSLAAVPFGTILIVLIGWIFISFPLCLFGTVFLQTLLQLGRYLHILRKF